MSPAAREAWSLIGWTATIMLAAGVLVIMPIELLATITGPLVAIPVEIVLLLVYGWLAIYLLERRKES